MSNIQTTNDSKITQSDTSTACGAELPQKQIKKLKVNKTRKEPTAAQKAKSKAVRFALREKSQEAKLMRSLMVESAKTPLEALNAANTTLNYIVVGMYKKETGHEHFKTFHDWKKEGYSVNKGATAFAVWGTPKRVKDTVETESGEVLEGESWEFWPLCYLFNESQVAKKDDQEPAKDKESIEEDKTPADISPSKPVKASKIQVLVNTQLIQESPLAEESEPEIVTNSVFVMSDYSDRLEAKKDRLEDRATAKRQQSDQAYKRSYDLVSAIPFGQPILVGHHSEARHRKAVDTSWNLIGKSVSLDKEAASLAGRAASVGTGGISSNDPEALIKLKEKLKNLVNSQETMKAVNKIVKSKKLTDSEKIEKIVNDELLKVGHAQEILNPDFAGRVGFASYSLQNNNAEIRRTQKRIEELEKLHNRTPLEFENDDFSMNINNGQIVIDFSGGKPNEVTRKLVGRAYSFKWSRYQGAWVRKVTSNAMYAAERLLNELKALEDIY